MAFKTNVTYRANKSAIDTLLKGRTGPVVLHMANKGREAAGHARRRVGVKSGRLKSSIDSKLVPSRGKGQWNVELSADAPYAMFHHDGRGAIDKSPGFLVFEIGGVTIFTHHVRGVPPNRFLLEGARAAGLDVRRR